MIKNSVWFYYYYVKGDILSWRWEHQWIGMLLLHKDNLLHVYSKRGMLLWRWHVYWKRRQNAWAGNDEFSNRRFVTMIDYIHLDHYFLNDWQNYFTGWYVERSESKLFDNAFDIRRNYFWHKSRNLRYSNSTESLC